MTPDELAAIVTALAALEPPPEKSARPPAVPRWRVAGRAYGEDR